jgi:hypothetical protein
LQAKIADVISSGGTLLFMWIHMKILYLGMSYFACELTFS